MGYIIGPLHLFVLASLVFHCYGDASQCWTCTNEANFRDCRANGYLATCDSGDTGGCQTEVRNENGNLRITKKCKNKSVCESEATSCQEGFNTAGAICYFCCTTDACNIVVEGECVDNCQLVPEGSYHSCDDCSHYRTCSSSTIRENLCNALVWNDKIKNCDWDYNSKTCPDYTKIGTEEPFKCWTCDSQSSFEDCNSNGGLQTCGDSGTYGCQTTVTFDDGQVQSVTKGCATRQTCESEESASDSRCPPSNQAFSAGSLSCKYCCTTSKCNHVSTSSCSTDCQDLSVTDYQSCIQCDMYISCSTPPADGRPCANGQDGNRLLWDNSIPTCVAASSTCPPISTDPSTSGPCAANPCQNNGVCAIDGTSYTCSCVNDYTGDNCETPPSSSGPCDNDPCKNDGACAVDGSSYTCSCVNGYTGDTCETEPAGPCDNNPCENNGVCQESGSSYSCQCATGYKGTNCADTDECAPNPCENSGNCIDGSSTYSCVCQNGYTGDNCQTADATATVCDNNPCQNGGSCDDTSDPYSCTCADGYSGDHCEEAESTSSTGCDTSPCSNGGTCQESGSSYTCSCPSEFTGDTCQTAVAVNCSASPCENGAECIDGEEGYSCTCASGYTGDNCESELGSANAQVDTEQSESSTDDEWIWLGVGTGVAAGLVGLGCLIFFLLGRKPKRKAEEEDPVIGTAPASTTMATHGPKERSSFNSLPSNSPTPVDPKNSVVW